MKAKRRLALTADKTRVVPYESTAAAFLFAAPGQEIPKALAEKYGLVDGDIPAEDDGPPKDVDQTDKEAEVKEKAKPEDKWKAKPETKPIIKPETKRRK